jgi:hypothetical protein
MDKLQELREYLETLAKKSISSDDDEFNAYDDSGGNFDDAYNMGCEDGETLLARELLAKFF